MNKIIVLLVIIIIILASFFLFEVILQAKFLEKYVHQEIERHLIDSETIQLAGELENDDFIILMEISPWPSEVYGGVTIKTPCSPNGEQLLQVIEGVLPEFTEVKMTYLKETSNPPLYCVYQGDLGNNMTFVGLKNISGDIVSFKNNAGYSASVAVHGEIEYTTHTLIVKMKRIIGFEMPEPQPTK